VNIHWGDGLGPRTSLNPRHLSIAKATEEQKRNFFIQLLLSFFVAKIEKKM